MDQDFHYYGTYYAARAGGFSQADATRIAKASNFIDFLHEGDYGGYWSIIRNHAKKSNVKLYDVIDDVTSPRYTFQGTLSSGAAPEDGLWCSYHFTPGNFDGGNDTPTHLQTHGEEVAKFLPGHIVREVDTSIEAKYRRLLNRPQSPLSRALILDTILCATDNERLEAILQRSHAGWDLLENHKANNLALFKLMLLGVRSHVIADTWAHQDWSGVNHKINTYWDIDQALIGRQAIRYQDIGDEWHKAVLSSSQHENLQAVPNGTSYLGHGWMGHFPDYSFIKYQYRPCWQKTSAGPLIRDNPEQYRYAWVELCSLFSQALGQTFSVKNANQQIQAAYDAIKTPCKVADRSVCPRDVSSKAWVKEMTKIGVSKPTAQIDATKEPSPNAVLTGKVDKTGSTTLHRYGTYYIHSESELYLFQIAADYHFHFVKHYLKTNKILDFTGSWSQQMGTVSPMIKDLF